MSDQVKVDVEFGEIGFVMHSEDVDELFVWRLKRYILGSVTRYEPDIMGHVYQKPVIPETPNVCTSCIMAFRTQTLKEPKGSVHDPGGCAFVCCSFVFATW